MFFVPRKERASDDDDTISTAGHLRVVLVEARVPPMDKDGSSDPYCTLLLSHGLTRTKRKSATIKHSLNPVWNQAFDFERVPVDAKLTIDVYDQDSINSDFIGKVVIHVAELELDAPPLANWLALPRGEVLIEVCWSSGTGVAAIPLAPAPPTPTHIEVRACTWNVGNALPPSAKELRQHWLGTSAGTGAGLIAVGSQECSFKPVPHGFKSSADFWFAHLAEALGDGDGGQDDGGPAGGRQGGYKLVAACSLGQMHLALFCARGLLPFLSRVESQGEATGIAHVLGNKGGLAISCDIAGTSACFVSAHLAAHQAEATRRASDFVEICRGITLRKRSRLLDLTNRFSLLVWCGDLNYRLDLSRDEVLGAVRAQQWERLWEADQLRADMATGVAFAGFEEGPLVFPPTFKHVHGKGPAPVPGSNGGSELQRPYEEEKKRTPSWCDRVLWREWPAAEPAQLLQYSSAPQICTSDHTPVHATLRVALRPAIPRPPARPEDREQFSLVLTAMAAHDLVNLDKGSGGGADPYVRVLLADAMCAPVCSAAKPKTLEPRWEQPLIVPMPWLYASAEAVSAAHLLISIMDKDLLTADDSLGHCVVTVGSEWPLRVRVPLTRRGRVSGEFSMVIDVRRRLLGPLRGQWPSPVSAR